VHSLEMEWRVQSNQDVMQRFPALSCSDQVKFVHCCIQPQIPSSKGSYSVTPSDIG
jgi:hypothetical protein